MSRRLMALTWLCALWLATSMSALAADPLRHALDTGDISFEALPPPRPPHDEAAAQRTLDYIEWLQRRGEFDAAQPWHDELSRWIDAAGPLPLLRARLLVVESKQHVQGARPEPARVAAAAAVALLEVAGDSADLARALSQLATALRSGDRRSESLAASDRAVAMHAHIAPDSNAALWALVGRVGIQRANGQFAAANQTLETLEAMLPPDTPDIMLKASVVNQRGVRHLLASELPAAEVQLTRAAELLQQVPHPVAGVVRAMLQHNLAMVYWDLGDLGQARVQMRAAIDAERRLRPGTLALARGLINDARLHVELGNETGAALAYAEAETIVLALAAGQPIEAYLRANQAELAAAQGHEVQARRLFQRAIEVNEKQPRDCYCAGPALRDYAWFLGRTGKAGAREALTLIRRVRALLGAFDNRNIESLLVDRQEAELRLMTGDLTAAADLAARARVGLASVSPRSANHALALHTEGLVARAQGRQDAARLALCTAVDVLEAVDLGDDVLTGSRFRAHHAELYHACVAARIDAGDAAGALDVLEQGRARSLLAMWRGNAAALEGEPQSAVDAWIDYRQRRAAAAARAADPEQSSAAAAQASRDVAALDVRYDEELARLDAAAPRTATLLVPRSGTSVFRRLPDDALLLAYSVGADDTLVLEATFEGVAARRIKISRTALAAKVAKLRERVLERSASGLPDLQRISAQLHQLLLAPHAAAIARRGRLLVLADGPLLQLPFAALYDSAAGRYAVAAWPIVQVESMGALALERRDSRASDSRALIIADPSGADATLPDLPALPGAQAEARSVRRVLGAPALLLRGASASESRVKREAGSASLLHFAVHGVLDDVVPLDSALILGRDGSDDGALRVREILGSMQLHADIVVLSACNTAVDAEVGGDGLVSMTRAFRQAGAARVVATLWPIADHGAAELMGRFHRALAAGATADAALREAQLALIGAAASRQPESPLRGVGGMVRRGAPTEVDLSHPFYWSGFQLYGRPERADAAPGQ